MERAVDIVDSDDKVIGKSRQDEADDKGLLHRLVHCIVLNNRKEIFLVKRANTRKRRPNLYDASVGGHVKSGESYEEAIKREGLEELGIIGDYKFLFKHITEFGLKHIIAVFILKYNGKINLNTEEFASGEWKIYKEIMKIPAKKFTPEYYADLLKLKDFLEIF